MGWINYFGRFGKERIHRLADWLDDVLKNWARATLKRCARSYRKSQRYLDQLREQQPHLFAHWHLVRIDPEQGVSRTPNNFRRSAPLSDCRQCDAAAGRLPDARIVNL